MQDAEMQTWTPIRMEGFARPYRYPLRGRVATSQGQHSISILQDEMWRGRAAVLGIVGSTAIGPHVRLYRYRLGEGEGEGEDQSIITADRRGRMINSDFQLSPTGSRGG